MADSKITPLNGHGVVNRYQPLILVLAAQSAGIGLDRYWPVPAIAWWFLGAAALVGWWFAWRYQRDRGSALLLIGAVVALGGAWHHCRWYDFPHDDLGLCARPQAQPVCLRAVAIGGPRRVPAPPVDPLRTIPRGDQTRLLLRMTHIRNGNQWQAASGRALLLVDGHVLGVQAGDRLQLFAQLVAPGVPQNPGQFDYARHLRAERKLCLLRTGYPDCVSVLSSSRTWSVGRALQTVRSRADTLLWTYLSHERSGMAAAVLLGARQRLDPQRTEAFFMTGTIHLLAISGLHVGMLASVFFLLARIGMLPRGSALVAVMLLSVSYALLTDARPPVVRATILVLVTCTAWLLRRRALPMNTLAAAAILVLLMNPADLFRVGTQLSFLAVATLVCIGPLLRRKQPPDPLAALIARTRPWPVRAMKICSLWAWGLLLSGTAIWLVTLPLVLYRFHIVSPVALLLNCVVWFPMLLTMLSGFGVLVFGWLIPPLGTLCGHLCDANLSLLDLTIGQARSLPGSHFWAAGPAHWWVVGFYAWLVLWAVTARYRPPRRWCVALLAAWIALGLGISLARDFWQQGEQLACTFLAVGHGTAVMLELPGGQTMLYDAGRLGSHQAATRSISGFMWSRGLTHLDAVVLSHADADHYNALPGLLERFSIATVYVSPLMFDLETPALSRLREAIEKAGVPLREIHGADLLRTSGPARIEVLHPPRKGVIGSDNANSIVLLVQYAGRQLLLPGDLESPGLDDLMAESPLDCDVVMAPHHGSARSNPTDFSAWCTPQCTVISGGHSPKMYSVITAYQAVGSRVLHTSLSGAVRITLDKSHIHVRRWHDQAWK